MALSRQTVQVICDDVPTPIGIDLFAAQHARENIVAGVREQLVFFDGEFDQTEDNVREVGDALSRAEYAAYMPDGTRQGLRSAEALTVGPGYMLQKLFSSVVQEPGTTVIDMVDQLDTVMRTVNNRRDQLITMHVDRAWFPLGSNPSIHSIKSLESVFVSTRIGDLLLKNPSNKNRGYVMGVMETFATDGVSEEVLRQRQHLIDESYAVTIGARSWDLTAMYTPASTYVSNSLQMMRLFFDPSLLFARRVTMENIVRTLMSTPVGARSTGSFYAVSSSIADGIIDIFPGRVGSDAFPQDRAERVLLGNAIVMSLDEDFMTVSGLPGILSFDVVRVELMKYITFSPSNVHLVAERGRRKLVGRRPWKDFEALAVLLPPGDAPADSDIFLGMVGNQSCIVPVIPILGAHLPSHDDITRLLVEQFAGERGLSDLWCGTLEQVGISAHCLEYRLFQEMLAYCGLEVVGGGRHDTLMSASPGVGVLSAIYVRSTVNPREVMEHHGVSGDMASSDAYFNYYYAKLKCKKKDSSSKGGNIPNHVTAHPYWAVMAFPFVDKNRTTCNDWSTMTYSLGVVGARNNYLDEFRHLYSRQVIDMRHLEVFADYVFLNVFPAGIGFHGSKRSGMGSVSLMAMQQSESLLVTEMYNKPIEPASNLAVSVLFGLGAEGVAINGQGSRERAVDMFALMQREQQYRVQKKYEHLRGRKRQVAVIDTTSATSSSEDRYMEMLTRFRLMETDPYQSILTFKITPSITPDYPRNLLPVSNPVKRSVFGMLQRARSGVEIVMAELDNLTPVVVSRVKTVTIRGDVIPMPQLFSFIQTVTFYGGTFR